MLQDSSTAAEDLFKFIGMDQDRLVIEPGKVSMLLVRIEEEKLLRNEMPHIRRDSSGGYTGIAPDIKLHLWLLLIAKFSEYEQALRHLSNVIGYFQKNRVFNRENSPNMDVGVSTLLVELLSPSLDDQHKIWGQLQAPYQPSVLYKVTMSIFRDPGGEPLPTVTAPNPELAETTWA